MNQYHIEREKEKALVVYVTEGLKISTENTARFVEGKAISKSYSELIEPPKEPKNAAEIINGIKNKLKDAGGES